MKLALEDALVDAAYASPLLFAEIVSIIGDAESSSTLAATLAEYRYRNHISEADLDTALAALVVCGLVRRDRSGIEHLCSRAALQNYAAVLRGVAQAKFRQKDANSVEVVLSPPAKPSKLMEALPNFGFAWADLQNTRDGLIALAKGAARRLVIVSPFIDAEGIDWVDSLFAVSGETVGRTLIVRGEPQLAELRRHKDRVNSWHATISTFSIKHAAAERALPLETFHAKLLLADSSAAYIGSANMNRASRDTSLECGTLIRGPAVKSVASLVEAMLSVGSVAKLDLNT
jgi:hypothetical protein